MTHFVRTHQELVTLTPQDAWFRALDWFEGSDIPLLEHHVYQFWGFEFPSESLELDDENVRLYIGLLGGVWVAYVTNRNEVTEYYLGIEYGQLVVFVDDESHDRLETSGNKVVAMWLPTEPMVKIAWQAGAQFPKLPGLSSAICRQILNHKDVRCEFASRRS